MNSSPARDGASALLILAFLLFYKLGDSMCTALATPFYLDMGFSKTQIGLVAKNAGLWLSVTGGLLGGLWMVKIGINKALWLFGVVQVVSIFGFAWLASAGHHAEITSVELTQLAVVIGLEALGVGLGTVAFVAFIARATHPAYTATQFALFTSLTADAAHLRQCRHRLAGGDDGLGGILPAVRGAGAFPACCCCSRSRRGTASAGRDRIEGFGSARQLDDEPPGTRSRGRPGTGASAGRRRSERPDDDPSVVGSRKTAP